MPVIEREGFKDVIELLEKFHKLDEQRDSSMEILSCQTSFLPLDFHRNCILRNGVNIPFYISHTSYVHILLAFVWTH